MEEVGNSFLQIFDALMHGDNELISQATKAGELLLQNPLSATCLVQMIIQPPNLFCKKMAAIFLRRFIKMHKNEISDPSQIVSPILNLLLNEQDFDIMLHIINAIYLFDDKNSQFLMFQFAQNAANSGQKNLLMAAVMLCKELEFDLFPQQFDFFYQLIEQGMQNLEPTHVIELAFSFGDFIDNENNDFFEKVWNFAISYVCQHLDDVVNIKTIISNINFCYEPHPNISPFAKPEPILSQFIQIIGNENVDVEVQTALCTTISLALDIEGVLDNFNIEELYTTLLQKFFMVSALAYCPTDDLSVSDVGVFSEICYYFAEDPTFLDIVFSLVDTYFAQPSTRPGVLLIFRDILGEMVDDIKDNLPTISTYLIQSVNDQSKLVRDCAASAICEFASCYYSEMNDYVFDMTNAVLTSLNAEMSQDMVLALCEILTNSSDTNSVFPLVFPFLMDRMKQLHEAGLQLLFPCFTELCSHSEKEIKLVFNDVVNMLFHTIHTNEFLIENCVKCLASICVTSSDLFAPYVDQFVQLINQYLQSGNESLQTLALLSYGKVLENHAQKVEPLIPQLIEYLIKIGSQDLSKNLRDEILEFQQQQELLLQGGKLEFEINEEDDDNTRLSPYAIPSLGLSVLCSIAMRFPQIIPNYLGQIMECLKIQMNNVSDDSMYTLCKAISLLATGISKITLPNKNEVSAQLCQWTLKIICVAKEIETAGGAIDATAHIIDCLGAASIGDENQNLLLNQINAILDGNLECQQNNKQYIVELHDIFCDLINYLIASLGNNAPQVLSPFLQRIINLATDKKHSDFRDFGIRILGQLVEYSSSQLPRDLKENILMYVIAGIQKNSRFAAYSLNQFTNGDSELLLPKINDIMNILYQKLIAKEKKAITYIEFIDNIVATIAEIRRNVLHDNFPIQQFASLCLSKMPARQDPSVNLDMMNFYVWLSQAMHEQPADEFAAVGIRLFMQPRESIGGIAEDDSGVLQNVAVITTRCLQQIPNANQFIQNICGNDEFNVQRALSVVNSVHL